MRSALGASRLRLAAQVLSEGFVIAIDRRRRRARRRLGRAPALIAGVLPRSIVFAPFRDAGAGIRLDPWVLGFTALVSLMTGLLFSLAPIAGLRRPDLKAAGDRSTTGRLTYLRTALVAVEVALALVVLVAAGLMVKSLVRLVSIDPGLDPSNVLVVEMALPQPDFYGPPVRKNFCTEVTDRAGTLPGVAVGRRDQPPAAERRQRRPLASRSTARRSRPEQNASASYRLTCPGYFKSMGIRMIRGRDFDARDATEAPGAVIINEETAKRYWPNEDPIGRRIKLGRPTDGTPWMTVVGVVANVRHFGLDDVARREMFRPYSQGAWPVMTIVAKTAADPAGYTSAVRAALQRIDPDLPVARVSTMESIERNSMGSRRFPMMLLAAFGARRVRAGGRRRLRRGELRRDPAHARDRDPRGAGRAPRAGAPARGHGGDASGDRGARRSAPSAPSSRAGCSARCSSASSPAIRPWSPASRRCSPPRRSPRRSCPARARRASIRLPC